MAAMLQAAMSERRQEQTEITGAVATQIRRHAEAAYPAECCGIVRDSGVRACRNVQDELHAADPQSFPRTSRRAFRLADAEQLLLARSFDGADPVRVLYHSHVDADAYFSASDLAGAMLDGRPLYPDLLHLVVAVRRGVAGEMALFRVTESGATELWRWD